MSKITSSATLFWHSGRLQMRFTLMMATITITIAAAVAAVVGRHARAVFAAFSKIRRTRFRPSSHVAQSDNDIDLRRTLGRVNDAIDGGGRRETAAHHNNNIHVYTYNGVYLYYCATAVVLRNGVVVVATAAVTSYDGCGRGGGSGDEVARCLIVLSPHQIAV
jgi:hypothetical protein|uniref:Uncharacterized protein n=1 Tax=Sipha flava TaxID=143950 RepID=A0A2S2QQM3_9HEMI